MTYDPERHNRRSIRLPGYDYTSPGAYFVTICIQGGTCALGEIVAGAMVPNQAGRIVEVCWTDLPNHYPHVRLDAFAVMPNHVHGIIILVDDDTVGARSVGARLKRAPTTADAGSVGTDPVGAGPKPGPTMPNPPDVGAGLKPAPTPQRRHALPEIVRALKTFSARRINELYGTPGQPFWQRNYYEHIIRNERELNAIRDYILNNPLRWELDQEYPGRSASPGR